MQNLFRTDFVSRTKKSDFVSFKQSSRGRGAQQHNWPLINSNLSKKNTRLQNLRSYFTRNLKEIHFDKKCQGEIQHLKFKNLDSTS